MRVSSIVVSLSLFLGVSSSASAQTEDEMPVPGEDGEPKPPPATPAPAPKPAEVKPAEVKPAEVKPTEEPRKELEPGSGTPRDYAPDGRAGHVFLRAGSGLVGPVGHVRDEVPLSDETGVGVFVSGSIGIGVSRHAELDATFQTSFHLAPENCDDCAGNPIGASIGATYHLAQGIATDPWIRYGVGYRTVDFQGSTSVADEFVPGRYHGIDVAQISFGVEFTPVPGFQFGPYLGVDAGTFFEGPALNAAAVEAEADALAPYAYFVLGARFTLDPVSWFSPPQARIGNAASTSTF